jgi:type II secretory pathway pseudopilin PulG/Zn-dependent protease with chaperone function
MGGSNELTNHWRRPYHAAVLTKIDKKGKHMNLVYKNEKTLGTIAVIIGAIVWLAITVGTFGLALVYVLLFFMIYLFAQSGFISHLRGNAVELTAKQCPDLYAHYFDSCKALQIDPPPRAYLMMSDGVLNALATKFLRRQYVVVYSSVVDALRSRPDALRFYFGHELGHIKQGHLNFRWLKMPALVLPLLGAAYRRAEEYTCDLHGLAASKSRDDALAALTVLGSGGEQLTHVNVDELIDQQRDSNGFWMSYHELTSDYPWLVKRLGHLASVSGGATHAPPRRSFWAGLLAFFTPRFGVGGAGSLIVLVAIIGILAAIAIPAYRDYTVRAQVSQALVSAASIKAAVDEYVTTNRAYPNSLEAVGVPESFPEGPISVVALTDDGLEMTLRSDNALLDGKVIVYTAFETEGGGIGWRCGAGTVEQKYLPASCRSAP